MTVFYEVSYVCGELQRLNDIGEGYWSIDDFYYFDHLMETLVVLQREMFNLMEEGFS